LKGNEIFLILPILLILPALIGFAEGLRFSCFDAAALAILRNHSKMRTLPTVVALAYIMRCDHASAACIDI
jgi:hypothetical protein